MTEPIPFAGLAPDARTRHGAGEIVSFDARDAIRIGRALQIEARGDVSTADVARMLIESLEAFEHDRRSACVLARAFVTRRFDQLAPDLAAGLRASAPAIDAAAPCLRLIATRGLEPAWCDVAQSSGHRALLLADGAAGPMVVELARQLRLGGSGGSPATSFYVADAATSDAVPARQFVTAYDVRSVVGFGATAWPGETFVVVAFLRAYVGADVAHAFELLGLHARLAWLASREGRAALGDAYARAHGDALDDLVVQHEAQLVGSTDGWQRRIDTVRREADLMIAAGAKRAEAHAREQRRTHRAMLNVIEDLREARASLASRVEERTRDLAVANTQLEARNRELEEFVYIASHDLQEPLRTVAGYLQMIQRRYGGQLGVEADEFIGFAVDGAHRMRALIESLLLYSRVSTSEKAFEFIPLDEPLGAALQNLAIQIEESGAVIDRGPLPRVRADPVQMTQLFQNLLSNAIKFAGPRAPHVRIASDVVDGMHAITVRDEGIGFNAKYVDRIFKIFRRLHRDTPGTGIGLAVCKKIAERHGGRIEAHSAPGEGATFTVHLPIPSTP